MRSLSWALGAALLFAINGQVADVQTVLAGPRHRVQSADDRASGHLVRIDADGTRTSYGITLKAWGTPAGLHVLLEISSPTTARAHILLERRTSGQTTIQIAHPGDAAAATLPFEAWSDGPLGAGFSYEDFLETQYLWQNQALAEATKYGMHECNVLKSTPGTADRTHYAEVRSYLDQRLDYPVYVEKTLKGAGGVKEFTYFGMRQNAGVWSPTQIEVKTRGHGGSTLLIIERGSSKAGLDARVFSVEQLIHF